MSPGGSGEFAVSKFHREPPHNFDAALNIRINIDHGWEVPGDIY
jgi:hypothetical protein